MPATGCLPRSTPATSLLPAFEQPSCQSGPAGIVVVEIVVDEIAAGIEVGTQVEEAGSKPLDFHQNAASASDIVACVGSEVVCLAAVMPRLDAQSTGRSAPIC